MASSSDLVVSVLRAYGPLTRTELMTRTGLSRPTVSAVLASLGSLVLEDSGPSSGGRPASVFRLTRAAGLAIGVDIGRRHIRVAVADLGHSMLADHSVSLTYDADDHPVEVLDLAASSVTQVLSSIAAASEEVVGVGLGIPAPLTRAGRIGSPTLLPAWAPLLPREELSRRLDMSVIVDNDANLGALGEYVWGAGRGSTDLVYVKFATGIGAGIVLDGRLYRGSAGTAGELGHVTLDARGPICRCGNRGCVELTAGGRALLEQSRLPSLSELAQRALAGDPGCRRLLTDAGRQLGFALGGMLNLINPDRIVVGGFLESAVILVLDPLRQGLAEAAMAAAVEAVDIVPAALGERASALGGVALALGAR